MILWSGIWSHIDTEWWTSFRQKCVCTKFSLPQNRQANINTKNYDLICWMYLPSIIIIAVANGEWDAFVCCGITAAAGHWAIFTAAQIHSTSEWNGSLTHKHLPLWTTHIKLCFFISPLLNTSTSKTKMPTMSPIRRLLYSKWASTRLVCVIFLFSSQVG